MSGAAAPRWRWLPAPGTWRYHALLLALGILVLGPLGGLTASYMNFSIGFFVGGQVLAGLLGSTVTYGYGADGRRRSGHPRRARGAGRRSHGRSSRSPRGPGRARRRERW